MNVSLSKAGALFLFEVRLFLRHRLLMLLLLILAVTAGVVFGTLGRVSPEPPLWGSFLMLIASAVLVAAHPGSRLLQWHVVRLHRPDTAAVMTAWFVLAAVALIAQALIYWGIVSLHRPMSSPSLLAMVLSLAAALATGIVTRLRTLDS